MINVRYASLALDSVMSNNWFGGGLDILDTCTVKS